MWPRTEGSSATGSVFHASCSTPWAMWFTGPLELEMSVKHRVLSPLADPYRWIGLEDFKSKALPSSTDNSSPFEKYENQPLVCYWTLVETEHLPIDLPRYHAIWAGCYLTHQAVELGMHRSTPSSDGSGIHEIGLRWCRGHKEVTWRRNPNTCGPTSVTLPSLPQLAEKDFNHHVDKMTHSVNTCQLLSLQPLLLPNGLMSKSDSRSTDRGYIWPQQHGFLLTKTELAMATTKCLVFQHQRLTLSSWHSTTPLGDQPATWWQIDYTGLLPLWKGQHLLEYTLTLDSYLSFLHTKLLPKLPLMN